MPNLKPSCWWLVWQLSGLVDHGCSLLDKGKTYYTQVFNNTKIIHLYHVLVSKLWVKLTILVLLHTWIHTLPLRLCCLNLRVGYVCFVFRSYKVLSMWAAVTKTGKWKRLEFCNMWLLPYWFFSLMSWSSYGCGHWGILYDFHLYHNVNIERERERENSIWSTSARSNLLSYLNRIILSTLMSN